MGSVAIERSTCVLAEAKSQTRLIVGCGAGRSDDYFLLWEDPDIL